MADRKFNKILATVSAVAVMAVSSGAIAAQFIGTGGAVIIDNFANTANSTGASTPWTAGDSFASKNGGPLPSLQFGDINSAYIGTVDLNNAGVVPITVAQSSLVGSIVNTGGVDLATMSVAGGKEITFGGFDGLKANGTFQADGVFSGLGVVTLGNASSAVIKANSTFTSEITADAAKTATVTVNSGITANFADLGKTNSLAKLSLLDGSTANFSSSVKSTALEFTGTTSTANFADGTVFTGDANGVAANNGIMSFTGDASIVGKIGVVNALKEVKVGSGKVNFGSDVIAEKTIIGSGTGNFNKLTSNVNFTGNGTAEIANSGILSGSVTTNSAKQGNVVFLGTGTFDNSIGSSANPLKSVNFNGVGTVNFSGPGTRNHYAQEFIFNDSKAQLTVGIDHNLNGNIVATTDKIGTVSFNDKGSINGLIGTKTNSINIVEAINGIVNISAGDHYVSQFKISNTPTAGFSFADGANINGSIVTSGASGLVTFKGSSYVTDLIASKANPLTSLTIDGAVGKTVIFNDAVYSSVIDITNGGTIKLSNKGTLITNDLNIGSQGGALLIAADIDQSLTDINIAAHSNKASVEVANTVGVGAARTINLGQVGDNTNKDAVLNLLKINSSDANLTTVQIGTGSNIASIEMHNKMSALEFSGKYKISGITPQTNGIGSVIITNPVEFVEMPTGTVANFGTATAKLDNITLAGDHKATFGVGINVYANKLTNAAGQGTIELGDGTDGINIFDAENANALKAFNVAADTVVNLVSKLNANDITIGNDSVLSIAQDVTSKNGINAATANNGTVKFVNTAPLKVASSIGKTKMLKTIEFAGSDISVNAGNAFLADEYKFTAAAPLSFSLDDQTKTYAGKFINDSAAGITHTIILNKTVGVTEFTGSIASENAGAKKINVQLSDGADAKISTLNVQGANFVTNQAHKGQITLNATGVVINSIGSAANPLNFVQFSQDAEVTNGIYADDITVSTTKTSKIGGSVVADNAINLSNGSNMVFKDAAIVDAKIQGVAAGNGDVTFEGSTNLKQNIGDANKVNGVAFSSVATSKATIDATAINANSVTFSKGAVIFNDDIAITSKVTMTDFNVNTAGNIVTVNGDLNMLGANKLTIGVTETAGVLSNGGIVLSVGNNLTVDSASTLSLTIDDGLTSRIGQGKGATIDVVQNNGAAITPFDIKNVTVALNDNVFNKWVTSSGPNGGLRLVQQDNTAAAISVLDQTLSQVYVDNLTAMCKAAPGTDASNFLDTIATLSDGNGGFLPQATEAVKRLEPINTIDVTVETTRQISSGMSQRMDQLGTSHTAPASGDEHGAYGAWITPFMATVTQKEFDDVEGYRADTYGGTIGFDSQVNADTVIGGAITSGYSSVDYKDDKSGDKSTIDLLALSLYGQQQINDCWYAQSVATVANNEVTSTERRVTGVSGGVTNYEKVKGKYSMLSFSAESMLHYQYTTDSALFTPVMGFRYTRANSSGYTQYGGVLTPNLNVMTKATNKLDVVLGARVTGQDYNLSDYATVSPEAHAFVSYDLINKNGLTSLGIDGAGLLTSKAGEISRTVYNVGFSFTAEQGMMEYGLGYDAQLAEKRLGHQGTLKLRVNF